MTWGQFFGNPWIGILVGVVALILCWGPRNVYNAFKKGVPEE